ncbi:hypothetical protein IAW_05817 [Bacillus cereus str. Schrouff]|nr:hypothetical protein IAW_05817 [Bacillus cereus str. Schrouff]EOO81667.1 hypothetical protein IGY_05689 [Bacillus cereus K-5975c]
MKDVYSNSKMLKHETEVILSDFVDNLIFLLTRKGFPSFERTAR